MSQSEFSIIAQYFESLTLRRDDTFLGIGDDCAILTCPAGHSVAVSIDTLVEGIHFFSDVDPRTLGHKSLAVGLSDLAAMGATPAWFTLALTLPNVDEHWLSQFSLGLSSLAKYHNIQLVGGDTTRGPLTISIQVHGHVKANEALRRDGAQVGDLIYVTGTLGDAGAALQLKLHNLEQSVLDDEDKSYLVSRLELPTPRIEISHKLIGIATSAIDISDGLSADLGHIISKSGVGAEIVIEQLPLSVAMTKIDKTTAYDLALTSGDDYELCFTVPPQYKKQIERELASHCTQIGVITEHSSGFKIIDKKGDVFSLQGKGYDHFPS